MSPYSLRRRRLARFCYMLAMLSLAAGLLAGSASPNRGAQVLLVVAGVAGYILNGRRATALFFAAETRGGSRPSASLAYRAAAGRVAATLPLDAHPRRSPGGFSSRSVRSTGRA